MKTIKLIVLSVVVIALIAISYGAWDNDLPADSSVWNNAAGEIRANNDALEVELGIDLNLAHPYYQASAPSLKPDGSTALDVNDNGRLWVDSDDNLIYVLTDYSGPTWTAQAAASTISASDVSLTLTNTDEEDSDFGRQSRYVNKGEQSGGEATTLGYIEFSHDGTSDDEKGQVRILLNDGDDADSPSKQPIGYLATGKIDVSPSLSVLDEDDLSSDDDEVLATQQSIKAYVDAHGTVQVVNTQTGAVDTGTTAMPCDDTIPQNTEGDEFMTLAITPTSATNKLKIDVVFNIN